MGLYTIICLICNRLHEEQPIEVAQTAWYEKKDATFSDLLKAVRQIAWKDSLISRKRIIESFHEKGLHEVVGEEGGISSESSWIRILVEHLTAA